MAHIVGADGTSSERTNQVMRGIYELDGTRMTICVDLSEKSKRPQSFEIVPGREHLIMLIEKQEGHK
jgi:hypothetical protein